MKCSIDFKKKTNLQINPTGRILEYDIKKDRKQNIYARL